MSIVGVVANAQAAEAIANTDEADDEDPLAAVLVAEDAPGEQQCGEHEDVGVDGPEQLALVGAEVPLDGRQRDVEDRVVEDDDEQARDEHAEDRPAARVARAGGLPTGRGLLDRLLLLCHGSAFPPRLRERHDLR